TEVPVGLVAENGCRIDAEDAECRHDAGYRGDDNKQRCDGAECQRILRFESKRHGAESVSSEPGKTEPNDSTAHREDHTRRRYLAEDLTRGRAQCEAQTELPSPFPDHLGDHAVETNRR